MLFAVILSSFLHVNRAGWEFTSLAVTHAYLALRICKKCKSELVCLFMNMIFAFVHAICSNCENIDVSAIMISENSSDPSFHGKQV